MERDETNERPLAGVHKLPTRRPVPGPGSNTDSGRTDREPGTVSLRNEEARAVFVISVAAELAGVHPQTLRIYERKGLVGPSRTGGGSRRYSQADIERIRHIGDLTAAGLNLEGVRRVLEFEVQLEQLRMEIDRMRADAAEAIERIHRLYRRDLVPLRQTSLVQRNTPRRSG